MQKCFVNFTQINPPKYTCRALYLNIIHITPKNQAILVKFAHLPYPPPGKITRFINSRHTVTVQTVPCPPLHGIGADKVIAAGDTNVVICRAFREMEPLIHFPEARQMTTFVSPASPPSSSCRLLFIPHHLAFQALHDFFLKPRDIGL